MRNRVTPADAEDWKVKVIAILDAGNGAKTTPMLFQADTPLVHRIVSAARRLMPNGGAIAVSQQSGRQVWIRDIVLARMRHGVRSCPARVASAIPGATRQISPSGSAKRFQLDANGGLHARACDARPSSKFGHTLPHYGFFERPGQPRKRGKTSTKLT